MKKRNKKIVDGKQIVLAFGGTQNHSFIIWWYAVEKRLGTPDLNEPKLFSHKNIPFFYTMLFCSALMVLAYLKKSCIEFCALHKSIIYFIL